jgi:hypothetical protein
LVARRFVFRFDTKLHPLNHNCSGP